MASRLNPYLTFNGDARAAMEFYAAALGGTLTFTAFGDFGAAPEGVPADGVMHAMLEAANGITIMASDVPPGMDYQAPTGVRLSLSGTDDAELRRYWDALSAGGTVGTPLSEQMWGDVYGDFVDKFGIPWLVNIGRAE